MEISATSTESQLVTNMCCILACSRPKETDDKKVFIIEIKSLTLEEQKELVKKFKESIKKVTSKEQMEKI